MQYFVSGLTKEGLVSEYRKLAKKYHPDICHAENATEIMQEINKEYDEYFVKLQKQNVGVDWDDLSRRYDEARKSRYAELSFLNFDKKNGCGWFTFRSDYSVFSGWSKIKYSSDESCSWKSFHGGFALTRVVGGNRWDPDGLKIERIPAKIESPSLQDMYFAMMGSNNNASTELQDTTVSTSSAYVSLFGEYKLVRTKNHGNMFIDGDCAFMKVNGLVMNCKIPRYLWKDATILGIYTGEDFGFYMFQECSKKEFYETHDVDYVPKYSESLGCKKLESKELLWIDDPVVAHFARIGIVKFYESGENFRMRYGTFSSAFLTGHIHEMTIDDAEHIQDYLDELNESFEEYVKRLIKKGKIRLVI